MPGMTDKEKIAFYERQMRNNKRGSDPYMKALIELRNIPGSGYELPSNTEDQPMANDPSETKPEKSSTMKDGGMARGKGNKMYQHNYATGGSVTDHLKSVPADNKGLSKLPEGVRNQMGYMSYGGMAKKKGKK
jgi:hypothetical protein